MASRGRRGRGRRGRGQPTRDRSGGWEEWGGYMNAKRQKLNDQFEKDTPYQLQRSRSSGTKIFAGISIHVNGYTNPSSDGLRKLMMEHGGAYEHYLYRTRVTHVIATNLPDSKVRELKGLKVVKPEWIMDSIKAGKLLDYSKYQLYTAQSGLQHGLQSFAEHKGGNQSISSGSSLLHQYSGNQSTFTNASLQCQQSDNQSTNTGSSVQHEADNQASSMNGNDMLKNNQSVNGNTSVHSVSTTSKHGDSDANPAFDKTATSSISSHDLSSSVTADRSPAKAGDPKFLNEFYSNSRLHYLSTWKAEFKSYVNELQSQGDDFTGREKLRQIVQAREATTEGSSEQSKTRRCVMHIDMDCFFVSVGLRNRPDLRGKPIAVTHSKGKGAKIDPESDLNFERREWEKKRAQGRKKGKEETTVEPAGMFDGDDFCFPDKSDSDSEDDITSDVSVPVATTESFHSMAEIASCSYEARQAGVKNGMFMGTAKKLCPDLITIPYDFEGYKSVSKTFYGTVASFTHDIEAVSCDELLVDCTDVLSDTGATPLEFATHLRKEISRRTGCTASAGIGSNILLAKMATRKAKPNGQFHLKPEEVNEFIKPQSVRDIPGVGWSLTKRFEAMNVVTCGDLQKLSLDKLQREFGPKTGQSLYKYSRGQDDRPIKMEQQRKSVSAEVNYGIRFSTDSEAVRFVQELSEEVCTRLRNVGMKGKTVTLKLMVRREDAPKETSKFMGHGICNNVSKSVTLPLATDDARIVGKECVGILKHVGAAAEDLRGIGIQIQKLEPAVVGQLGKNSKHQSILNFAVSASKSGAVAGADKSPVRSGTGTVQVDSNAMFGSNDSLSDKCSDIHSHKSRGSHRTGQDVDQNRDVHQVPSEGDSMTSGLKTTQLGRTKAELPLPPLPRLPSMDTPEKVQTPLFKPRETTSSVTVQQDDYLVSPSQVDLNVLKELPSDIRGQIEQQLGTRLLKTSERPVCKPGPSHASDMAAGAPGCSHWQPENGIFVEEDIEEDDVERESGSVDNGEDRHASDAIVALPSPSQIDPSCLSALPEAMQKELRMAYAQKEASKGSNSLKLQQAKSPLKSPSKRSPGKRSPGFKVPRGRPKGRGRPRGSSRKLQFKDQQRAVSKQISMIIIDDQESNAGHTDSSMHLPRSEKSNMLTVPKPLENETGCRSTDINQTLTEAVKVNQSQEVGLCGAVQLQEVRCLIKEWITSSSEPVAEDEEIIMGYLNQLVNDKNLEQVQLLLKFMCRVVRNNHSSTWYQAVKRIMSETQSIVEAQYGSTLVCCML